MLTRPFGGTDFSVSVPGFGAGHIGSPEQDDAAVGRFLNELVDMGISLFDTARGYGLSEERIGRHLQGRRGEIVISTKVGYGVEGTADWSYDCVARGVDAALGRLCTDRIDIVHLHSCPRETLERGDVIAALEAAKAAGKVGAIAYSGENDALDWAVSSGRFDSLQCSVNFCDQRSLRGILKEAAHRGMGVIAKRPLANICWRFAERPHGDYAEEYWHRYKTLNIDSGGMELAELAARYSAWAPGVSTCILGSSKASHIRQNIEWIAKGPLPAELLTRIDDAWRRWGADWWGQV